MPDMSRRATRALIVVTAIIFVMAATAAAFAAPNAGGGPCPKAGNRQKGGGFRLMRATAEHLGVEPSVVRDELRQGKTLAEIAVAHGKTRESLKAALVADGEQRLQKAAQSELKLTADEVRVLRGIQARAVDLALDRKWPGKR